MSTNIKLKKSSIAGRIPSTSDLDYGELAINYADGKLFYKNSYNQIKSFIDSAAVQSLIDNINTGGGGTDSASVISLILSTVDSDYIALREADVNGGLDSTAVLNLIPAGTYKGIIQSSYTATAGQANFSADYTVGQVLVYLNGLLLSPDDYVATNGTSVSLVVNADSGDEIRIVDIIAGGIDSSASLDLIESTIDSAYVAARGLKYTDFSVSIQAPGSPNLSFNNTNGVFSYTPPNLSSYVTTASLSNYGYTTYDSADTLGLVDSDYVQSKFTTLSESDGTLIVSGSILPDLDSTYSIGSETKKFKDIYLSGGTVYIDDLGLSANANGTITIGQLDSIGVLNSIGVIATVDSEQVGTIVDSAYLASRLTNYVTDTELAGFGYTTYDSTNTTGMLSGYATQSYVTTQINNLIGGAPSTLDTLNEIAAALNDDDSAYGTLVNLIGTKTDFDSADAIALIIENDQQRDSAFVTNIVDSAYIAARTSASTGTDSATVIDLITSTADSAYIAARAGTFGRVSIGENTFTADSGQTSFSVAYVPGAVQVFLNGILLSNGLDYTATNGSSVVLTSGADSGDALVVNALGGDSARIQDVVDSAYINARVNAVSGTDSATVEAIVEGYGYSTYDSTNAAGQIEAYGYLTSAIDSAGVIALITANDQQRDSGFVTGIVDSAYVQLRQDFAYSSLTGAPTNVSSFTNDAGYTTYDSNNFSQQITAGSYATQSYVTTQINNLIDGAPTTLDTLNEIAAALNDDDSAYGTLVTLISTKTDFDSADATALITSYGYLTSAIDSAGVIALITANDQQRDSGFVTGIIDSAYITARVSAGTDSATVESIITNTVDSAYIQARQSSVGSGGLDSAAVLNIFPDGTYRGLRTYEFTADSGQTTFTGADDRGNTLVYSNQNLILFLNGILLVDSADYTATDGSSIVLTTNADSGDTVTAFNIVAGGEADSAAIQNEVLSFVDSAYITSRASDQGLYTTDSVTFAGLTINGMTYPNTDGTANQVIVTDGSGVLTFDDLAVDAVYINVKNVSGGSLQKGLPVHQTGTSGNTLEVVGARADSAGLMPAVAILKDSLNAEEEGQAIISGKISGVNTSSFNEGDVIYVGATGGYTNVKPAGEGLIIQNLGIVTRVDSVHGGGVVLGAGRGAATPNLNDGNIFIGNSSNYSSTATLNTTIVPEGDNLYYTTARHDSDTLAQVDSAYVQQRVDFTGYATETYVGTSIDSAIDALVDGAPGALNTLNELAAALNDDSDAYNTLLSQIAALPDSAEVATIITSYGYSTYDSANATGQIEAYGYLTDAIDSARITSMLAADSFSIGGTIIGDGKVEVKNTTGSTPSYIDLYCEVSNAHYTRIQSEAHANYSGNVTLTTPTTSGTLALTSDIVDSAAIIALITANDQQRDSGFVTGIIDSDYINARVDAVSGTDSAATIALIEATVDSAYVALREANAGVVSGGLDSAAVINLVDSAYVQARQTSGGGGGGLDSAAVIALIDLNGGGNNNLVFTTYDYIATADQTTFSGNDKDGNGLTYNSGSVQVYRNGILLVETDDYTASNGGSVILNTGADSGDYISIATFEASISSIGISSYEFVADSGQTTFSGTATNGDVLGYTAGNLLVHLNGVLLTDSDDYTATSGTSIVLGVAADSADLLHITTFAASSRSQWGATNASITAVSNKKYIVDTSSAVTITLPSSPNFGDEVGVVDGTGNAGTNNITVSSSSKILASDSDLTLDINRSGVTLTYYNSTQGWIITSTV